MKLKNIENLLTQPLTRVDPAKLKEALEYCFEYITIAENNGCTTFDEFVGYTQGIFPLEVLREEIKKEKESSED